MTKGGQTLLCDFFWSLKHGSVMSVRYPASYADGISSKTTGGAEMAVHMSMKRSGVSRSDVGLESSLMKRRSPPVGYSHDIGENVKLPLFSEGSELQKLDCDRQNNDIFNFKDCICESVTDLRSFYPLKNVKNVAIVGSLAYCSRVHLVKIFAQSGMVDFPLFITFINPYLDSICLRY